MRSRVVILRTNHDPPQPPRHKERKAVVGVVPPDWVLDKGMYRTLVFLDNLADYLMSDTYAERAAKRASSKARSMMKRNGEIK